MNKMNEKEYEWLRTEMRRHNRQRRDNGKGDPNDEELEDLRDKNRDRICLLVDGCGDIPTSTQGRSPGPLYIETEEE